MSYPFNVLLFAFVMLLLFGVLDWAGPRIDHAIGFEQEAVERSNAD